MVATFRLAQIHPRHSRKNILAQQDWDLPALAGVASALQSFDRWNDLHDTGIRFGSRLVYCPDPSLNLKPVPDSLCEEVQACVDVLLEVIADFPFVVDDASRANALAILFSILMAPVIKGHVPLAIVDAPNARDR